MFAEIVENEPIFAKKGSFWLVAEIGLQHCDRSQIIKFIFGSSLKTFQLEILLKWNSNQKVTEKSIIKFTSVTDYKI